MTSFAMRAARISTMDKRERVVSARYLRRPICLTLLALASILVLFHGCCEAKKHKGQVERDTVVDYVLYRKYNLVDMQKSYRELTTQAYITSDPLQRMQIFDYLLTKDCISTGFPGRNALDEFFKHFGETEHPKFGEMELVKAAIAETTYRELREHCYSRLVYYYLSLNKLQTASMYIDTIKIRFPQSKYLRQIPLDELSEALAGERAVLRARRMSEPERLWKLGLIHLRFESDGVKTWGYNRLRWQSRAYFDSLKQKYPRSPFTAAAEYASSYFGGLFDDEGMDTTRGLARALELEALLAEHPRIPIRDEILLDLALVYSGNAEFLLTSTGDTAKARTFFRKADGYFKRMDLGYFKNRFVVKQNLKRKLDHTATILKKYRQVFSPVEK